MLIIAIENFSYGFNNFLFWTKYVYSELSELLYLEDDLSSLLRNMFSILFSFGTAHDKELLTDTQP